MGNKVWFFFCGICMGAADIVPGISGGTVAFLMGFYEQLIETIKGIGKAYSSFFQKRNTTTRVSWSFFLLLLMGIAFSFLTLAGIVNTILNHETYRIYLYCAFWGLITASIFFCAKQLPSWKASYFLALSTGVIIAWLLTGTELRFLSEEKTYDVKYNVAAPSVKHPINYNEQEKLLTSVPLSTLAAMLAKGIITDETLVTETTSYSVYNAKEAVGHSSKNIIDVWTIICGAIAICAMLLPGISGSYLLNILGMYGIVIGALADLISGLKNFHFDRDSFLILLNMGIGILAGALLFSHAISWMLRRYRSLAIALLTGFMIGALRSVWPFWSYAYSIDPLHPDKGPILQLTDPFIPGIHDSLLWIGLGFALTGFLAVILLESLASSKALRQEANLQKS